MNEVVQYIIRFLLYGNTEAARKVAYAPAVQPEAMVTIIGNGIDGELHYPDLSDLQIEQLPDGHFVVHTDIVYTTFFFISRAEEVLNARRDKYGRFLAKYSLLNGNNRLTIPLIDEYSRMLMKLLQLELPQPGFAAVHLTHDIDTIAYYRHLRGMLGGLRRGHWREVAASIRDIHNDPAYTFPWMIEQDAAVKQAQVIYFAKHTSGKGIDYPQYNLHGKDYLSLERMVGHSGAQIGIHSGAYATCPLPAGKIHRSHYLNCPVDRMQQLAEAGYTDDYSMGFADRAGFRLQTTRPVRWINPHTRQLTDLTLHPLTLMDCTLSNDEYMRLNEDEAYFYATELIQKIRQHNGEVNLLWHNTVFADNSYHRQLYPKILQLLQ